MEKREKVVVYPGTFDPITNGHLSIISRALKIFDKLIIAILNNPQKVPLFSMEERIHMIREVLKGQSKIEIDSFDGLLVDYVVEKKTNVVVRGLRALSDFEYEFQMALMNRKLNREVRPWLEGCSGKNSATTADCHDGDTFRFRVRHETSYALVKKYLTPFSP